MNISRRILVLLIALTLVACGGGGGSSGTPNTDPSNNTNTNTNTDKPAITSATFANLCRTPRTGTDKYNKNLPYPDKKGTLADEQSFLRYWINETYLWYDEVPQIDATVYATPEAYFADLIVTPNKTASGKKKDRFHFTYPTAEWNALSQDGTEVDYGITWSRIASDAPQRKWVVLVAEPGSPAALAGIKRGDDLLTVDGEDFATSKNVEIINAALSPIAASEKHRFVFRRNGSDVTTELSTETITNVPVQNLKTISTPTGTVGYMTFSEHTRPAELALINAFNYMKDQKVSDLVIDLRYNGGGALYIASELAYMIAGQKATNKKIFEQSIYNNKIASEKPMPFFNYSTEGKPLPALDLRRVSVLTTKGTCSASEALINGLRGIDIEVHIIGDTTCGKPYAFFPEDNCGTTYFAIQSKGQNQKGFSDYADGFPATCYVADDYTHALGDPNESLFAAALSYRTTKSCPAASVGAVLSNGVSVNSPSIVRPLMKEISIRNRL